MNTKTTEFVKNFHKKSNKSAALPTLTQVKKIYISWVFEQCNGNKSKAAKILGINRRTLQRIMCQQDEINEIDIMK